MARADIQYIRSGYTDGTAARKLVFQNTPQKAPLPQIQPEQMAQPEEQVRVAVDPLSVTAIVVAALLLVMMVVSLIQIGDAHREQVALQEYVYTLKNENVRLDKTYREGYDLAEIEAQALALGMVPAEQLQTMHISGRVPAPEAEPTFWENVQMVFAELFANAKV